MRITGDLPPSELLKGVESNDRFEIGQPLPHIVWDALRRATRIFPEKELHFYGDSLDPALTVLDGFEHLQRLSIHVRTIDTFAKLSDFSHLRSLALGDTNSKRLSISPIECCSSLQELWIEGHSENLHIVASLPSLQTLSLRSVRTKTFEGISNASAERLEILYSGVRDLKPLASMSKLGRLWMGRIRGLAGSDLASLAEKPLGMLALNDQPGIEDLSHLGNPDIVHLSLDNLSNLNSLSTLQYWPVLSMLGLRKSRPSDGSLVRIIANPRLRHLAIAMKLPEEELAPIESRFEGLSLSYQGSMLRGERPRGIIVGRLDL